MLDAVSFSNAAIARSFGGNHIAAVNRVAAQKILGEYDPESLSKNDIKNINDQFRANGIPATEELSREIKRAGFDPEALRSGGVDKKSITSERSNLEAEKIKNDLKEFLAHLHEETNNNKLASLKSAIADIKSKWSASGNSFIGNLVDLSV